MGGVGDNGTTTTTDDFDDFDNDGWGDDGDNDGWGDDDVGGGGMGISKPALSPAPAPIPAATPMPVPTVVKKQEEHVSTLPPATLSAGLKAKKIEVVKPKSSDDFFNSFGA